MTETICDDEDEVNLTFDFVKFGCPKTSTLNKMEIIKIMADAVMACLTIRTEINRMPVLISDYTYDELKLHNANQPSAKSIIGSTAIAASTANVTMNSGKSRDLSKISTKRAPISRAGKILLLSKKSLLMLSKNIIHYILLIIYYT